MIGRGALGAPWIFKEIKEYLNNGIIISKPALQQRINIMMTHIKLMLKYSEKEIVMKEARKHINWYLKGFKNAAVIRNKVSTVKTLDELKEILKSYLDID